MKNTILILLLFLAIATKAFAQEAVDEADSIFNLQQFIGLILGLIIGFIGFIGRDLWVRKKDKDERQKKALQSIIKELEMILNIIKFEERKNDDITKDIMFDFPTEAWNVYFGEIDLPSESFAATQEAYSAVSKINRYAQQAKAVFPKDHSLGAKVVSHQKQYAEQTGKQIIQNALDQLRAQIPNKKAVEPAA